MADAEDAVALDQDPEDADTEVAAAVEGMEAADAEEADLRIVEDVAMIMVVVDVMTTDAVVVVVVAVAATIAAPRLAPVVAAAATKVLF